MGMFQPQNYGTDFVQGATGIGNLVMNKDQQDFEQARQTQADARTQETFQHEKDRWADEASRRALQQARAQVQTGIMTPAQETAAYNTGNVSQEIATGAPMPETEGPTVMNGLKQKILAREPLSPEELATVKDATAGIKWLQTPEGRQAQQGIGLQLIHGVQTQTPSLILDALNKGALGDIHHGDARDAAGNIVPPDKVAEKKVVSFHLSSDGKVYLTKRVTLKDGYTYEAPATVGGAAGDNAELAHETIPGVIDKLEAQRAMIDLYDTQLAGLGDEAAVKRIDDRSHAVSIGEALEKEIPNAPASAQPQLKVMAGLLKSGKAKSYEEAVTLAGKIKPEKEGFTLGEGGARFSNEIDPKTGMAKKIAENPKEVVAKKPEINHYRETRGGKTFDIYKTYQDGKLVATNEAEYQNPLAGLDKFVKGQQAEVLKARRSEQSQTLKSAKDDLDKATADRVKAQAAQATDPTDPTGAQLVNAALDAEIKHKTEVIQATEAIKTIDAELDKLTGLKSSSAAKGGMEPVAKGGQPKGPPAKGATAKAPEKGKGTFVPKQSFNKGALVIDGKGQAYIKGKDGYHPAKLVKGKYVAQ